MSAAMNSKLQWSGSLLTELTRVPLPAMLMLLSVSLAVTDVNTEGVRV